MMLVVLRPARLERSIVGVHERSDFRIAFSLKFLAALQDLQHIAKGGKLSVEGISIFPDGNTSFS